MNGLSWATVRRVIITPLASIFGSGVLVIVPILVRAVGPYAPLAMVVVGLGALLVGSTVRHNILCAEPALREGKNRKALIFERLSSIALIGAYVIAVCLYLHILSAFVLGGMGLASDFNKSALTTAIILVIVVTGLAGGLRPLERIEGLALYVTLAVIVVMIVGFGVHDVRNALSATGLVLPANPGRSGWEIARIVAGTLIVVQGFETPRYLGDTFDVPERIRASRWSQHLSMTLYVVFVAVAVPVSSAIPGDLDEGSLVELARVVAAFLPVLLIVAAAVSQFSASVADTIAAGANVSELTRGRIGTRLGYVSVGVFAIVLAWTGSTLTVVALASRAFAFYYLMQCLVAFSVCRNHRQRVWFTAGALVSAFVLVFAIPVG